MPKIQSIRLGDLEVDPQAVYQFPQGLYGLEELTEYAIVQPDQSLPFAYLQSLQDENICLLIADPFAFYPNYEFDLPEADVQALGEPATEQVVVWVTVSARESLQDATVNLLGPVVLNKAKQTGRQVILHNSGYQSKSPLFAEPQKEGK